MTKPTTRTATPKPDQKPDQKPGQEPGHYGAGYGEQVPEDAPPQLGPATDGDQPPGADPDRQRRRDKSAEVPRTTEGDDGTPVAFTPADVHARPPDRPPTENAPESEKVGLLFERS